MLGAWGETSSEVWTEGGRGAHPAFWALRP